MPITPGTKLGPYEIISPLGAGGMGEVYRAKDIRLGRDVAIKVLPSHLSSNPDLKQRFDREAKTISQLQHPHICTLYDVGSQDGVDFLVMEMLEGESLFDRLQKGAMPLDQVLKIAMEIAEALDKAHRAGIIHRDLKPANVMLTKSGAKLLDFGLAKPHGSQPISSGSNPISTGSNSPGVAGALTQTSIGSALTSAGSVIGTVQYMSPEQIAGNEADIRSDIFGFGAMLYEMASGKRAFEGKTPSQIVGSILANDPPPVSSLQPLVPASFDSVISTCLKKEPEERFQSAHDLKLQLKWVADYGMQKTAVMPAVIRKKQNALKWIGGAAVIALALLAGWLFAGRNPEVAVVRAEIPPPAGMEFEVYGDLAGVPMLSPQGDKLVFLARKKGEKKTLWVRPLNSLTAQMLEGTEGAAHPFWSPDGKNIGFFSDSKLCRIPSTGGPVVILTDVTQPRGGTWGAEDVILYTPDFRAGLMRISASGGQPSPATTLASGKHTTHRFPWFLPDGKHFLYLATSHEGGRKEENGIYFASVDGKENRLVVYSDAAGMFASGYLLYHTQTALVAQPFDPGNGRLSGEPVPVVNNVRHDAGVWRSVFSVSQTGILIFQPGSVSTAGTQMTWFDRTGAQLGTVGERDSHASLDLSPDGKQVAYAAGDPNWEIWTIDLERKTRTRLTFNEGTIQDLSWTPDGKNIVYNARNSKQNLTSEIHMKAANGTGSSKTFTPNGKDYLYGMPFITPDGKDLVYLLSNGPTQKSLWAVPVEGGKPFLVLKPPSEQANILGYRISPDGKWVAYMSDETGTAQVFITSFPKGEGKWQVSTNGGAYHVWRKDSKEFFYMDFNETIHSVSLQEKDNGINILESKPLFKANIGAVGWPMAVTADGKKFLINKAEDEGSAPLYLVVNWPAELKKK